MTDYPSGERAWRPSDTASPLIVRAADRLYEACRRAIMDHRLDARSEIGDAVLDYRQERDEMAAQSAGAPKASVTEFGVTEIPGEAFVRLRK